MDKNAIKKYAVWARRELISRVSQKALQYGITDKNIVPATATSVNGIILSADEMKQRKALIERIDSKDYAQVMEEVAYTWFNRFIALRFMEVNGYLPTHVRVFTDEENRFKPQILTEAITLEMPGLDMEKVYALKDANDDEALLKYLIITQCNALSPILPGMFQRIADDTELLFPDNLLREGSVIQQMIELIPEEDWKDAVQIIGWLYQYYNSEKKDEVFAALKKNVKITKENIPAATQLFTPDWIVRYMVENSLGRIMINNLTYDIWAIEEKEKIPPLKKKWKYFVDEAEQQPEAENELRFMEHCKYGNDDILPFVDTTFMDPCTGSGHILAYAFEVYMDIYMAQGWGQRDAVRRIIEKNLFGLDIDRRAAQLTYFAIMMKARQYDPRFLKRTDGNGNPDIPQPHVYAICESNDVDRDALEYFVNGDTMLKTAMDSIVREMHDAKEYGSILKITPVNFDALYARFDEVRNDISMSRETVLKDLLPLVQVAETLAQKYDVVVTNPPYMGSAGMSEKLSAFVKKYYPDSKSDLFAVFIERCGQMTKNHGYQAMITQHAWMFLSSFEKLRGKLLQTDTVNMAHLGARAFEEIGGEVVQTTSFVLCKRHIPGYKGTYCRLVEPTTQQGKENMFLSGENRYAAAQDNFSKIPGSPVAYWLPENVFAIFNESGESIKKYAFGEGKNVTTNNAKFILYFWEVNSNSVGAFDYKWLPCAMGGEYRKWYGNIVNVIDWSVEARQFYKNNQAGRIIRKEFWDMSGVTWGKIGSAAPSFRLLKHDQMYQETAVLQESDEDTFFVLAVLNTKAARFFLSFLAPTLNFQLQDICAIPLPEQLSSIKNTVIAIGEKCVEQSRQDWDSFETSWDFRKHPLVPSPREWADQRDSQFAADRIAKFSRLSWHYEKWESECQYRFDSLKANEEELNRIFIDIYGLQDELTPEVADKDVTVRRAELRRDIRSLISYAVGCMFGRYSLDVPGLAYAGGEWDASKYVTFPADKDNIIPICDDEYFEDDIVGRFVRFIEVVYGKDTLQENLRFIADALGGGGQPKDVIRNYFLNDFYADHLKIYQKRPIYWLFDSGKKGGFKALVYMHRYQPDTIARMRTDYVHEQQARYRTAIADLEQRIASASTSERVKLSKRLKTLQEQATEIQGYEEKIHHLADQYIAIDLDDGVKKNYEIFKDVLAKIK